MAMSSTWRRSRLAGVGLAVLALSAACSSGSKSSSSSSSSGTSGATATTAAGTTTGSAAASDTIASHLTLGGPPECQQNAFCIPGLQKTYGITFKEFKPLDSDGPLTYQAVQSGAVDVAEVYSTDAQVVADNLVVLNDDKHLQAADAITPVIRHSKDTPAVAQVVNNVSSHLTTDILRNLNKSVGVDKRDPETVADQWLGAVGLTTRSTAASGVSLTIAGFNFPESNLLAYVYGDALKDAGANVTIKDNLGARATLEPGLQSGQIDMLIEYAASDLEYLDKSAGLANGDINNNISHLKTLYGSSIDVLTPSTAIDTNAFAVTKATAQKYGLVNMSDLTKPFTG
jgi:osmoprotectant transport system substrate-binding protein